MTNWIISTEKMMLNVGVTKTAATRAGKKPPQLPGDVGDDEADGHGGGQIDQKACAGEEVALVYDGQIGGEAQRCQVKAQDKVAEDVEDKAPDDGVLGPAAGEPFEPASDVFDELCHARLTVRPA